MTDDESKNDKKITWPLAVGASIGVLVASGGAIRALQGGDWKDLLSGIIAGVACIVIGSFIAVAASKRS